MKLEAPKVAAFLAFNSAGHIQGLLAVANRLRDDYKNTIRCVFILAGPPHSRTIEDHGHELIELEDQAEPFWDFEIEPDDDLSKPMDEATEQLRLRQGKKKRPFRGGRRWPQLMARHQYLNAVDPKKTHLGLGVIAAEVVAFTIQNSKQVDEAIDALSPDVIICDVAHIQPTVLKHELTRPWVRLWSSNPLGLLVSRLPNSIKASMYQGYQLRTKQERQEMKRTDPLAWQALLNEWDRAGREVREAWSASFSAFRRFYEDEGCTSQLARLSDCGRFRIDSPHLNIYMFPAALDYDQDDDLFEYPARWLSCDSFIRKTAGKSEAFGNQCWLKLIEQKKLEGLASVVYFSLGSIASGEPSLMQRYIDYLAGDRSNRLYIVSEGVNGDRVELCERNTIGANYLPQTFLLQQSDLAVIHGGNNSLTESFYHGKPVIVLPGFGDQFDNAQRVHDLGLGRRLNLYDCSRDEFLAAIEETLSDRKLIARASAIGADMRSRDDLGRVSAAIRELIEKRRLSETTARELDIKLD